MRFMDAVKLAREAGEAVRAREGKDYWSDTAYDAAATAFYKARPNHQGEDRISEVFNAMFA